METPSAKERGRVAVVGASVRAAAQSAVRAGYEVVAADLFADRDLKNAAPATRIQNYPEDLLPWLKSMEPDAWFYTGALENHPDLVDAMSQVAPLWGNAGKSLRRVRDHAELRKELTAAGLSFPRLCDAHEQITFNGRWLAKTRRSSSGSGVWAIDSRAAFDRARAENAEVEQRLDQGFPASVVYAVSLGGATRLGISRQIIGSPLAGGSPFQHSGSIVPCELDPAVDEQLGILGGLLRDSFGLRGLVGVDLWIGGSQAYVLEVNPRYTASVEVLELAHRSSAFALHAAASTHGCAPDWSASSATSAAGKLVLFAAMAVTVTGAFSDWAIEQPDLADIPHAGIPIQQGQPVLTLLAQGPNADERRLFAARVAEVNRRLYADA